MKHDAAHGSFRSTRPSLRLTPSTDRFGCPSSSTPEHRRDAHVGQACARTRLRPSQGIHRAAGLPVATSPRQRCSTGSSPSTARCFATSGRPRGSRCRGTSRRSSRPISNAGGSSTDSYACAARVATPRSSSPSAASAAAFARAAAAGSAKTEGHRHRAMTWVKRLKRVFAIEIERCWRCGGRLRVIASIENKTVIERILHHLESHCEALDLAHASRAPPGAPSLL